MLMRDLQDAEAILPGHGAAIPLTAIRLFAGALKRDGGELPHWQYFLGFRDDFTCPAREAALTLLKLQGCTSALDCQDVRCRRQIPMLVQRVKEQQARREQRDRVAEIGEE